MIDYSQYKLAEREAIFAQQHKDLPQPTYAILWEDPADPDAAAKVTVPSPTWLAMAMHGGILPPVWVYHELAKDEAKPDFKRHTRGWLLHDTPPVGPMTEEEAIEYLVQKDLPPNVWRDYRGNRTIMKIVPRHLIPTDRTFRNAWRINQTPDTPSTDEQVDDLFK